jgi:hypothetical protein
MADRSKDDNKKLTKVLSTKLSIEDYERFQKCTNFAYKSGEIEPSTSKFLRFIVTYPFKEMGVGSLYEIVKKPYYMIHTYIIN